jgi:hypothetical protein
MSCKLIEDYIAKNYYVLNGISKNITKGHELHQELLQEVILQILERDNIVLKNYTDNDIKYYITAALKINWHSKTSPFYYKIRKERCTYTELSFDLEHDTEQESFEKQQLFDILEQEFTELDWFRKSLMEMYLTLGSLKKVSQKTTIPLTSISRYIKESKEQIKNNIKNNYE